MKHAADSSTDQGGGKRRTATGFSRSRFLDEILQISRNYPIGSLKNLSTFSIGNC